MYFGEDDDGGSDEQPNTPQRTDSEDERTDSADADEYDPYGE